MHIECSREGDDMAIIEVRGELELATAGRFLDHLGVALRGEITKLLVDLRGVSLVDSAGVRALVHARRRMWRRDGRAAVLCADGPASRSIRLMGLYDLLECTTDEHDARARLGAG